MEAEGVSHTSPRLLLLSLLFLSPPSPTHMHISHIPSSAFLCLLCLRLSYSYLVIKLFTLNLSSFSRDLHGRL